MAGDRERCLAAGADAYLSKPFVPEALEAVVAGFEPSARSPVQAALGEGFEACRSCRNQGFEGCQRRSSRPALDLDRALATCGGDEQLRRDVTVELITGLPRERAALRAAVDGGDGPAAARVAHKMKSSLAALGAIPAGDAAAVLESAARQGDVRLPELASRFACELDRALEALERSIQSERVT